MRNIEERFVVFFHRHLRLTEGETRSIIDWRYIDRKGLDLRNIDIRSRRPQTIVCQECGDHNLAVHICRCSEQKSAVRRNRWLQRELTWISRRNRDTKCLR